MKKCEVVFALAVCFSLLMGSTLLAQISDIDSFTSEQPPLIVNSTNPIQGSSLLAGDIMGVERDLMIEGTAGLTTVRGAIVDVSSGNLAHSQSSGVEGYTVIQWDGLDGDPFLLDPIGLRLGGHGFGLDERLDGRSFRGSCNLVRPGNHPRVCRLHRCGQLVNRYHRRACVRPPTYVV